MRMSRGVTAAIGVATVALGAGSSMPADAASKAEIGWHVVHEPSQPSVESDLTLPAARYCGGFDLQLKAVRQDVRSRVLTRWNNGKAKDTWFSGPLVSKATNSVTGKSRNYNLGGDALEGDDASGTMRTYRMFGPVGMGMPVGSARGAAPGYYVMDGYHLVLFGGDGSRTLEPGIGHLTNLCTELR